MKAYELLFIVAPSTDEETRANTMNRILIPLLSLSSIACCVSPTPSCVT